MKGPFDELFEELQDVTRSIFREATKVPEPTPIVPIVVSDPGILGGVPIAAKTRVPVAQLIALRFSGATRAELRADYPSVGDEVWYFIDEVWAATAKMGVRFMVSQ
jgi:uncharacterized protein (DUF433 family)